MLHLPAILIGLDVKTLPILRTELADNHVDIWGEHQSLQSLSAGRRLEDGTHLFIIKTANPHDIESLQRVPLVTKGKSSRVWPRRTSYRRGMLVEMDLESDGCANNNRAAA